MTLKEQLDYTMKAAMKARDDLRLSAVRMIKAAVKNREIEKRCSLDDQSVMEVITAMAKQRRESIRLFREGNRQELANREEAELAVLLEFLPSQLTPDDLTALLSELIRDLEANDSKDLGRVMKAAAPLTAGRADGKIVSEMVRQLLK